MVNKHIILVGFMCSGKTTLGKRLAAEMHMPFTDIDHYISKREGQSVTDIFKEKGEDTFRRIEHECLLEILALPPRIIASGGGTPCFFNNMELINRAGVSVYLDNPPQIICEWLNIYGKSQRPLLKDKTDGELLEYVTGLLEKRMPYYQQSDITVPAATVTPAELIGLITQHQNNE